MGSIGTDQAGVSSLGTVALRNIGGLGTYGLRLLALVWVPSSVVLNAVATISLAHALNFGFGDTIKGLPILFDQYQHFVDVLYVPLQNLVAEHVHFQLPPWLAHLVVIYGSTASALALSSFTVSARQQLVEQAQSGAASVGWPLALIGLLWRSVQTRFVSGFARRHTLIFVAYVAASFAAAYCLDNFTQQIANLLL
jgi:hypothetical protein